MKLCCFPARKLLYFLAGLGVLQSGAQVCKSAPSVLGTGIPAVYALFNAFLIVAVAKRHERQLKWAQVGMVAILSISILPAVLFPIIASSYAASHQFSDSATDFTGSLVEYEEEFKTSTPIDTAVERFNFGMTVGVICQIAMALAIGVEVCKYVLVSRCWTAACDTKLFVNENTFTTP